MTTGALLAYLLRWRSAYGLETTMHNEFQKSAVLMGLGDRAIAVSESVAHSIASRGVTSAKLRVVVAGR
jgi:hypothetical protein